LSRTARRSTGTSWWPSCRGKWDTAGSRTHRAAAHRAPSLTRRRAGRMHGAPLSRTQTRTRGAGGRPRCCSTTLLRARTLEKRLPPNWLTGGASCRRSRWPQRLCRCLINRTRPGLRNNHSALRADLSRPGGMRTTSGRRMWCRRPRSVPGCLSLVGLCRCCRTTRLCWLSRRLCGCGYAGQRSLLSGSGFRNFRLFHRRRRNHIERRWRRYCRLRQYLFRLKLNRGGSRLHRCCGRRRR